MDRRDAKKKAELMIKAYGVLLGMTIIPIILISLVSGIIDVNNPIGNIVNFILSLLEVIAVFIVMLLIAAGIVKLLLKEERSKEIIGTDIYVRELPKYFPPAIASYLLDLSIEITTDYTATVAYLISKKYISIENDELAILTDSIENLSKHEKYTFDCLTGKHMFDGVQFRRLILEDAKTMGLIEKGNRKIHFFRNIGIVLAISVISVSFVNAYPGTWLMEIFACLGGLSYVGFLGVCAYSLYLLKKYEIENYKRTSEGEEVAAKWSGVKKYLSEYTLLSERELDDIVLFEEYIPYAIALNEADKIEKYIEENDAYRKLIYGRVYNFSGNSNEV